MKPITFAIALFALLPLTSFVWEKQLRADLEKMADDLTSILKPWPVPKLSVDVDKLGAIPDRVTVNTAAIQKAIDGIADRGGGTVSFPKGSQWRRRAHAV